MKINPAFNCFIHWWTELLYTSGKPSCWAKEDNCLPCMFTHFLEWNILLSCGLHEKKNFCKWVLRFTPVNHIFPAQSVHYENLSTWRRVILTAAMYCQTGLVHWKISECFQHLFFNNEYPFASYYERVFKQTDLLPYQSLLEWVYKAGMWRKS